MKKQKLEALLMQKNSSTTKDYIWQTIAQDVWQKRKKVKQESHYKKFRRTFVNGFE